jgi:hypothetical protein
MDVRSFEKGERAWDPIFEQHNVRPRQHRRRTGSQPNLEGNRDQRLGAKYWSSGLLGNFLTG